MMQETWVLLRPNFYGNSFIGKPGALRIHIYADDVCLREEPLPDMQRAAARDSNLNQIDLFVLPPGKPCFVMAQVIPALRRFIRPFKNTQLIHIEARVHNGSPWFPAKPPTHITCGHASAGAAPRLSYITPAIGAKPR